MTELILFIISVELGVFGYLLWKLHSKIAWFIGSMESHSTKRLQLECREKMIPMIWWDPTIAPWPSEAVKHGDKVEIKTIYLGLPPNLRRDK